MRHVLTVFVALFALLISFVPAQSAAAMLMVSPVGQPMVVTSPQGYRIHPITGKQSYHAGVDLGVDYGDPIYAAAAGTVSYSGWMQGYGNTIMIDHGRRGGVCNAGNAHRKSGEHGQFDGTALSF